MPINSCYWTSWVGSLKDSTGGEWWVKVLLVHIPNVDTAVSRASSDIATIRWIRRLVNKDWGEVMGVTMSLKAVTSVESSNCTTLRGKISADAGMEKKRSSQRQYVPGTNRTWHGKQEPSVSTCYIAMEKWRWWWPLICVKSTACCRKLIWSRQHNTQDRYSTHNTTQQTQIQHTRFDQTREECSETREREVYFKMTVAGSW